MNGVQEKKIMPKSQGLTRTQRNSEFLISALAEEDFQLISALKLSLILIATCQDINGHWVESKEMKMITESIDCYR